MRKIPFAGIELTSQRVRGLRGTSELPGRPANFRSSEINTDVDYNIFCTNIILETQSDSRYCKVGHPAIFGKTGDR